MIRDQVSIRLLILADNGDYLGWKPSANEPYKWLKYSQAADMSQELGSGFIELGLEPAKETFIGIYARNRPEVCAKTAATSFSPRFLNLLISFVFLVESD